VGDSRIYLLRDGRLIQLTEDHSLVNEMLQKGTLTKEEASRFRYKNVITRAIGMNPGVDADSVAIDLLPGDRLLLCSDGLSDLVPSDKLITILRQPDIKVAVDHLVDAALEAGGRDNITVIAIDPNVAPSAGIAALRAKAIEKLFLFEDLPVRAKERVARIATDVFVKAPHGHDQVAWHVDTAATGPVCDEMLTLWLALTPASPDTGAVTYALGSHRQPLPTHADDRFGLVLTAQGVAALDRRRVRRANGPPGTANLHHLRTAHRSGPNHTDGRRVAVVVRYLTPRATPEAADCGRVVVLSGDDAGPFEATDHAPVFWSGPT